MPATPVKIGPFVGGLNTYSDPTAVADNEFVDALNFDVDLDGSLFSRPPFMVKETGAVVPGILETHPLGWFIWTDGTRYLIVASGHSGAVGGGTTHARNETTGAWTTISSDFAATAYVQYANKAWLIASPDETDPGGNWDPVANFVADADIPKGTSCVVYKERLFVAGSTVNPNRIYFSDAANFGVFQTSVNFFDARSGDGQTIVKLKVFQDTVVIFKTKSTYAFSYDSAPTRGAVRVINAEIGATNRWCIVEYDNSLYVLFNNRLFQFANWVFTRMNVKVPFVYATKWGSSFRQNALSILNDRIVIHFSDNIYVYNLKNGTWTKWDITNIKFNFTYFIRIPPLEGESERYYGGSRNTGAASADRPLLEWQPAWLVDADEPMNAYVVTKTYDFNTAHTFKRLFWWGTDQLNKTNLTYAVSPIVYSTSVTHEQMSAYTHDQLHSGSHLQPFGVSIDVSDTITIGNTAGTRMFIKLLKSLRFRQVYFTLSGTTNGSFSQAPLRIYSITAFIDTKQTVVKQIS